MKISNVFTIFLTFEQEDTFYIQNNNPTLWNSLLLIHTQKSLSQQLQYIVKTKKKISQTLRQIQKAIATSY
jgi:hypothetical protein